MSNQYLEFLKSAARAIEDQIAANPHLGAPVDPDVADYMGAFEEEDQLEAIDLEAEGEAND